MHTIASGLIAGFAVGAICLCYVLYRCRKIERALANRKALPYSEGRASWGLLILAFFSSSSLVWGFIGAGVYHLIRDELVFFFTSLLLAAILNFLIWWDHHTFARDRMLLTSTVFVGLGVLIPWMFDLLK